MWRVSRKVFQASHFDARPVNYLETVAIVWEQGSQNSPY